MPEIVTLNPPGRPEPAGFSHVAVASGSTTMYVVDWDESKLEQIVAGSVRAAEPLGTPPPVAPVTLVPVPRLFADGHLIEIDSTAVMD